MEEIWYTITGPIAVNTAHELITWVNAQIYNLPIKRLKLIISSNGGDIDSAIRIYVYLKSLPIEVETIAFSQIDSAANLIYVAGSKRTAIKGCRFFLHEGIFTIGNSTATLHNHEENLSILRELSKRHVDILSQEINKTEGEVKKLLENSTILNTDKAKELGLVHNIVDKIPLSKQNVSRPN
ncbi:hypothetical protein A2814_02980 [Candidatus Nomurabacteria bacterium RIFCSPHIGHO2_01_FULL_38_19]|uniref:ATP-dependent Clp protease proteolytic subunit n=1 Tax=Candidatus Nomurabacteria bacterium RIFCSPHIGHO2_01_FULL_38_19 TaxID=1801732 RepID=A0A1F6UQG9_9BACT|nr:MAG: hypothetical protein A2814_02980 [Candidatus Nomurabacteria bacterium RIFCSPHIGHO2_01_FULL_38_19]